MVDSVEKNEPKRIIGTATDEQRGESALGFAGMLLQPTRVSAMKKMSVVPLSAPFYPEQTHTMGLAFDAAWMVLAAKGAIAACDVEERREQLGRWIIALTRDGEIDANVLAHGAIVRMSAQAGMEAGAASR
jgi:hypothetical protein